MSEQKKSIAQKHIAQELIAQMKIRPKYVARDVKLYKTQHI